MRFYDTNRFTDGETDPQPKKTCEPVEDEDPLGMTAEEHRMHIESGRSADKAARDMETFVQQSNKRWGIGPVIEPDPDEPEPSLQSGTYGMSAEVKAAYESAGDLTASPANQAFKRTKDMSPIERFVAASNRRHAPNPAAAAERQRRIRLND